MALRIVGGSVGGRHIATPRGAATRPTTDRVRESIFNILAARGPVPAAVLDLYAGSGALGLEAMSRGAARAVFVERHRATAQLIRDNAAALGFVADVRVRAVTDAVAAMDPAEFGWIFADPPYAHADDELPKLLAKLGDKVAAGALVIAEHDAKTALDDAYGRLALCDRRRYGQAAVSFYEGQP